jgi:hypothetical protein
MYSLTIRRIIVWVASMVMGVLTALLIITFFLPAVSPDPNAEAVSVANYGLQYFFWTAFPLGLMFVTILDYFLDTKIWPD